MCPSRYFILNLFTVYNTLYTAITSNAPNIFFFHAVIHLTPHYIFRFRYRRIHVLTEIWNVIKSLKFEITVTVVTQYCWIADGVNVMNWFLFPFIFRSTQQILSCICSPAVALEDQQHRSKHHLCHGGIIEVGLLPS